MTARSMMLLVAAMSIAAFAVGCGGGDDSGEGTGSNASATTVATSSLSKAAFVKQASAICERERNKIVNAESGPVSRTIEVTMVPAFQGVVDEVRALGAPSGEEAQIEAFLNAMQKETDELEEGSASVGSLEEVEQGFKGSGALARKADLPKCAFYTDFSAPGT